ncbi:holliday junction resolvase [Bacillus phage Mater]|uniref:Holliday junction resolvase n=1 Tax=Bacillus phage Mater TaxID=1540090 RepID=A0A0A0RMT0_9CAUD|nr:RusA-like Holliday junction resolvase [Bacillus phage Mater]AIW03287.1 holliday junction resolvase [Bacillus phage Mater]
MASSGRGSKQKGSSYELKLAKALSKWSGEQVHRVPQSGAGGHTWGADSRMNGDIVFPVTSNNSFIYEAKKREGWGLHNLFLNNGEIKTWFEQVVMDARRMAEHGMSPCLIFSKNRDKDYVLLPYVVEIYLALNKKYPVSRQTVTFDNIRGETQYFDTLLTTLDGFTSFDKEYLFAMYRNLDWDWQNNKE